MQAQDPINHILKCTNMSYTVAEISLLPVPTAILLRKHVGVLTSTADMCVDLLESAEILTQPVYTFEPHLHLPAAHSTSYKPL